MADEIQVRVTADVSSLQSGMDTGASSVEDFNSRLKTAMEVYNAATAEGVEAQKLLGAAFDQASLSGATFVEAVEAANKAYQEFASSAQGAASAVNEEAAAALRAAGATTGLEVSARQSATAGIGILEGRMMSGNRAAGAFLATTLGLGPVIQAAFPVIGALALGEVLVQVGEKAYHLYEDFFNLKGITEELDAANKKLADDGKRVEDAIEAQNVEYIRLTQGITAAARAQEAFYRVKPIDISAYFDQKGVKDASDSIKHDFEDLYKVIDPKDLPNKLKQLGDTIAELKQKQADLASRPIESGPLDVGGGGAVAAAQESLLSGREQKQNDLRLQMAQALYTRLSQAGELYAATMKRQDAEIADDATKESDKAAKAFERAENQKVRAAEKTWDELLKGDQSYAAAFAKFNDEAAKAARDSVESVATQNTGQMKAQGQDVLAFLKDLRAQADAAMETTHQQNQGGIQAQETNVQSQQALGIINPDQALNQLRALHQEAIAEAGRYIAQEMAVYANQPKELERLQQQMNAAHQKGMEEQLKDTTMILQEEMEKFEQVYRAITSDLNNAIEKMITTTQKPAQIFAQMFNHIIGQLAQFTIQWIEKQTLMWIKTEALQLLGKTTQQTAQAAFYATQLTTLTASQAAQTAVITAAQTTQTAAVTAAQTAQTAAVTAAQTAQTIGIAAGHVLTAASNVATVVGDAAVAYANTYAAESAVDPFSAAAEADLAYAQVMAYAPQAAFEAGGIVDGAHGMPVPIMAHAGERVLSAPQTQNFERLVNQPSSGGGSTHLHYSPNVSGMDKQAIKGMLDQHSDHILDIVRRGYNSGKLR